MKPKISPALIARAYADPLSWLNLAVDFLPILALYRPPSRPVERLAARKASANLAPERLLEPHHSGLGDKLWLHTRGKAVGVTFASEAGQTLVMMIPSPVEIY